VTAFLGDNDIPEGYQHTAGFKFIWFVVIGTNDFFGILFSHKEIFNIITSLCKEVG